MKSWKKMNKTKAVLLHLEKYGYIDTWKANKLYNATRLSAIIYNLRYKYNLNIITQEIPFKDIYGTNSSYAKYILVKGDDNFENKNN
jgi:hypothetical protein